MKLAFKVFSADLVKVEKEVEVEGEKVVATVQRVAVQLVPVNPDHGTLKLLLTPAEAADVEPGDEVELSIE